MFTGRFEDPPVMLSESGRRSTVPNTASSRSPNHLGLVGVRSRRVEDTSRNCVPVDGIENNDLENRGLGKGDS